MIVAGYRLPERPQSRDEAYDRGFDRDSLVHDQTTPEPLSPEWQAALDASIAEAKALRAQDTSGVAS